VKEGLEVGICGTGPVWTRIEESLQGHQRLRVRWLGKSLAEAAREIKMLSPHAVLFEINQAETAVVAAIQRIFTKTKLIGLDPESEVITIYPAGRAVFSMENLPQVIIGDGPAGKTLK
jgi:hypothetical protein